MIDKFDSPTGKILELAAKLPTGLTDPRALEKYHRERQELTEALAAGDEIGAILEAADCVYYAIKSWHNNLINERQCTNFVAGPAFAVGLNSDELLQVCITKYTLRARPGNVKDDAAERAAVEELIGGW